MYKLKPSLSFTAKKKEFAGLFPLLPEMFKVFQVLISTDLNPLFIVSLLFRNAKREVGRPCVCLRSFGLGVCFRKGSFPTQFCVTDLFNINLLSRKKVKSLSLFVFYI